MSFFANYTRPEEFIMPFRDGRDFWGQLLHPFFAASSMGLTAALVAPVQAITHLHNLIWRGLVGDFASVANVDGPAFLGALASIVISFVHLVLQPAWELAAFVVRFFATPIQYALETSSSPAEDALTAGEYVDVETLCM